MGYANDDGTYAVADLTNGAKYTDGTAVPSSVGTGTSRVVYEVQGYSQPLPSMPTKASINYYYTISDGYIYVAAASTSGGQAAATRTGYANFKSIGTNVSGTGVGSYVSSRNSNAHPNSNIQNGNWYTFVISDHVDPSAV